MGTDGDGNVLGPETPDTSDGEDQPGDGLIYVGPGWIPDVPARDLTPDDLIALGLDRAALLMSGLYREADHAGS